MKGRFVSRHVLMIRRMSFTEDMPCLSGEFSAYQLVMGTSSEASKISTGRMYVLSYRRFISVESSA